MSTPPSTPLEPSTNGETGRPIVLIVEDEEPIAEALAYIIADAGYRPMVAPHGKAGLELALRYRPALIFTDLMMPHMGGLDLIRQLHAALNSACPPVILMTAAGLRFTAGAGARRVLKKPFELADIEALLRRFLEDDEPGGRG